MQLPPSLEEVQRTNYYSQMLKAHPWMAKYKDHFPRFHSDALKIIEQIKGLPGGHELIESRPDLISFEIQWVTSVDTKIYKLNEDTVGRLRSATFSKNLSSVEELSKQRGSFQGALTGVLSLVDRESAKIVFAQKNPLQQLNTALRLIDEIPEDVLVRGFKTAGYGDAIDPQNVSRLSIRRLLVSLHRKEQLAREAALYYYLHCLGSNYATQIKNLQFSNVEEFRAQLKAFFEKNISGDHARLVDLIIRHDFERIDLRDSGEAVQSRIEVRELAVFPALFRGELGGDCATSHSWPYPLSPFDRIFSVTIGEKEVGYVGGTMVTVDGKPTFYLRDVASGNLNARHIEQIWSGFYHAQKLLGVEQIILANEKKLHDVNNTPEFQTVIHNWYLEDKKSSDIVYNPIDAQIRAQFLSPKVSSSGYDSAEGNTYGILMRERPEVLQQYRVEPIENKVEENKPVEKLSKQNLHDLLLRALNGDATYIDDVLVEERGSLIELEHFIRNANRISLNNFYAGIEERFKRYDIQLSQKLVHEWQFIFMPGHLRSVGVTTTPFPQESPWMKWTIDFVINAILRTPNAREAYYVIKTQPSYFEQSEKFQNMVRGLMTLHRAATTLDEIAVERLNAILNAKVKLQNMFDITIEQLKVLTASGVNGLDGIVLQKQVDLYIKNPFQHDILESLNFHSNVPIRQANKILESPEQFPLHSVVGAALIFAKHWQTFSWRDRESKSKALKHLIQLMADPQATPQLRELILSEFGADIRRALKAPPSEGCEDKLSALMSNGRDEELRIKELRRKFLGPDAE